MRSGRDFTRASEYADAAERLAAAGWLGELRAHGIENLRTHGFPGKDEAWKYTRASTLLGTAFTPSVESAPPLPEGPWGDAPRVVFVDGQRQPSLGNHAGHTSLVDDLLSDSQGLREHVGAALGQPSEAHGFAALNLAFARDGAVVHCTDQQELHLVHLSTGAEHLGASRSLVVVDPGQRLVLYEHFASVDGGPALTSAAVEVVVGKSAEVHHVRVVGEHEETFHVGEIGASVAEGGAYRLRSVVLGSRLARIEVTARLEATGAHADLSGLSMLRGAQHADHHIQVDHATPHTSSEQVFRTVLDGRARSVYTGAVRVREGAVGTDSKQLHQALLLSDDAVANARPWLEIDNDDVSCTHGAAIGSLAAEALFYLRQRGLSALGARALLTWGFASESLAALPPGRVRDELQEQARVWLTGASA